jgi:hypothetical protein
MLKMRIIIKIMRVFIFNCGKACSHEYFYKRERKRNMKKEILWDGNKLELDNNTCALFFGNNHAG